MGTTCRPTAESLKSIHDSAKSVKYRKSSERISPVNEEMQISASKDEQLAPFGALLHELHALRLLRVALNKELTGIHDQDCAELLPSTRREPARIESVRRLTSSHDLEASGRFPSNKNASEKRTKLPASARYVKGEVERWPREGSYLGLLHRRHKQRKCTVPRTANHHLKLLQPIRIHPSRIPQPLPTAKVVIGTKECVDSRIPKTSNYCKTPLRVWKEDIKSLTDSIQSIDQELRRRQEQRQKRTTLAPSGSQLVVTRRPIS